MSLAAVRSALEQALSAMAPALETAWENAPFELPPDDAPYQRVNLLPNQPENPTFGDNFRRLRGLLQVTLAYKLGTGPADALARAELIQTTFPRGASFVASGITTTIERTPEIAPALIDGDRYCIPVRIRWFANIQP